MTQTDLLVTDLTLAYYRNAARVPEGITYDDWRWTLKQAADTVAWFFSTGRACSEDFATIRRCRIYSLVRRMALDSVSQQSASSDAFLSFLKNYLAARAAKV